MTNNTDVTAMKEDETHCSKKSNVWVKQVMTERCTFSGGEEAWLSSPLLTGSSVSWEKGQMDC